MWLLQVTLNLSNIIKMPVIFYCCFKGTLPQLNKFVQIVALGNIHFEGFYIFLKVGILRKTNTFGLFRTFGK